MLTYWKVTYLIFLVLCISYCVQIVKGSENSKIVTNLLILLLFAFVVIGSAVEVWV